MGAAGRGGDVGVPVEIGSGELNACIAAVGNAVFDDEDLVTYRDSDLFVGVGEVQSPLCRFSNPIGTNRRRECRGGPRTATNNEVRVVATPRAGSVLGITLCVGLLLAACSSSPDVVSPDDASPDDVGAADYCTETGGTVETRQPYWNTNQDQSDWVRLPGELDLCWYQTLDDDDESRIYLDLRTLYSETPTLAAAAYLAQLPLGETTGNPAAVNCSEQVFGSATFGNSLAGGGWVNLDDPVFTVVNLCVFPDGSAIDEWGIAYYTEGTARGIDLNDVFRFDPAEVPPIFTH